MSQHYSGSSPVTEEGSSERSVGRRIALYCASADVLHRTLCLSRQCMRQVCYSTALCAWSTSRAGDSRPLTHDGDSGASEHTGSSVHLLITPLLSPAEHLSHFVCVWTRPSFSETSLVSSLRRQLCHIFKVKWWALWWQVRHADWWPSCLSAMFSQCPPPGVVRRFFSSSPGGWERLGEGNVSETVWEPHFSLVVSVSRAVASTLNQYGFC